MNKVPDSWEYYFNYSPPSECIFSQWLFQAHCFQEEGRKDYIGLTLLGLTWSATRCYYLSPTWKVKDNFILSWLIKNINLTINT